MFVVPIDGVGGTKQRIVYNSIHEGALDLTAFGLHTSNLVDNIPTCPIKALPALGAAPNSAKH